MTKTITGTSEAYSDNWGRIFGKKSAGKKKATAKSTKKKAKKKSSALT
jgi:hypothetical protein